MTEKVSLTKKTAYSYATFDNLAFWNYERMQMVVKHSRLFQYWKLYPNPEDLQAKRKRHLEFFNTHPYIASPILKILALEEDRINGAQIDDANLLLKLGWWDL